MLRHKDWIIDHRPLDVIRGPLRRKWTLDEWFKAHGNTKENWLFSIIELLMKNQDWAGAYLLVQTHISTCKAAENNYYYNDTPWNESRHIRAVRLRFWNLVEKYDFALNEEEHGNSGENSEPTRAAIEQAEASFPFVGGKPRRRHSEAIEFFDAVREDRKLNRKKGKPA